MKKSFFLILGFSFLMFLFACNSQEKNNDKEVTDSARTEIVEENTVNEEFAEFYKKFVSDENFQIERIKFPVTGSNIVDYDEEVQWTTENCSKLSNIDQIDTTEFTVEINETATKVEHKIFLPNSGFGVSYAFELIDGKWLLTQRTDSNL